jgi:hypothetical protein
MRPMQQFQRAGLCPMRTYHWQATRKAQRDGAGLRVDFTFYYKTAHCVEAFSSLDYQLLISCFKSGGSSVCHGKSAHITFWPRHLRESAHPPQGLERLSLLAHSPGKLCRSLPVTMPCFLERTAPPVHAMPVKGQLLFPADWIVVRLHLACTLSQ